MPGPIFYSTNPWYATEITAKYRNGIYFAWVSEYFDSTKAHGISSGRLIAPSSDPFNIYIRLRDDYAREDTNSSLIKGYRKTFGRLAKNWLADGSLNEDQYDEILTTARSHSWKIWRPVLYVIPANAIAAVRILSVARADRAAYGPELKIVDLKRQEFDIIELE